MSTQILGGFNNFPVQRVSAAEKAKAENGEAPKANNDDEIIIEDNDK